MSQELVSEYLREQAQIAFAWGSDDCVHFAGGLVLKLTGKNPLAGYSYSTEAEAKAIIATAGSLRALVTRELGEPKPVTSFDVDAGSIVLTTYGSIGEIVGIFDGRYAWYRQPKGLVPALLEQCLCYWSIACP